MRPVPHSRFLRLAAPVLAALLLPLAAMAADPAPKGAGWNAQLLQCKEKAGSNLIEREKCVWKHCEGHWGQGACPPGENKPAKGTPQTARIEKCKADAGYNVIQREQCIWKVCDGQWGKGGCPKKADPKPNHTD